MNTATHDLRQATIDARDWFESRAKAASKGCWSSYELQDLRAQRDALDAALAAPAPSASIEQKAMQMLWDDQQPEEKEHYRNVARGAAHGIT